MSKFLHTMIRVSSIDETLSFFSLLGFKEVSRYDNEQGRFTLVFIASEKDYSQALASKAPMIELTQRLNTIPAGILGILRLLLMIFMQLVKH